MMIDDGKHWRRQLCGTGARTPPPTPLLDFRQFLLLQLKVYEVRQQSLASNNFMILSTTNIKII